MAFKSENHEDMSLFKNRLWKLMENSGVFTAKGLAKKLYKEKLVIVKHRDTTEYPYKRSKADAAIGSIEKKIQTHLNSDDTSKLQGEYAKAYSTFFHCSTDYLFGNIECTTHQKQICKDLTGLAEDAIDILIESNNSYVPYAVSTINFLLEKDSHINDKLELLRLIPQYILSSQNIKSFDECGVPRMENKNIALRDEYGTALGLVPVDKMANIFLLSINELLSKLKNSISTKQLRKTPSIFEILDDMLFDLIRMEEIRNNLDGFNFDIDNLSRMDRRFNENKKRLVYLYDCDNINDIDFKEFKTKYPQYSDADINLLKDMLDF